MNVMQKKTAQAVGRQGLRPKTIAELSYHNSAKSASPNLPRGGGVLSMTWELALMTIGTGWLIRQLFRLIDKIEER